MAVSQIYDDDGDNNRVYVKAPLRWGPHGKLSFHRYDLDVRNDTSFLLYTGSSH